MSEMNTVTTLRQKVADSIPKCAVEAERQSHDLYYYKLLVYRNGSLSWSQFVTASEGTIDPEANHFAAIPDLCCVGRGSCACDCDYCSSVYSAEEEQNAIEDGVEYNRGEKYTSREDAIADALSNGDCDLSDVRARMLEALDDIPIGYFYDEQ
jgi:hypothetical protein